MQTQIIIKTSLSMLLLLSALCIPSYAGDLDDGIEIDDKIVKYDTLGKPGVNIKYISRRAKSSASCATTSKDKGGDIVIGGFINKPGANVKDVTIIFNGEDIIAASE